MPDYPLVSCLTPTADRRTFWPRCLRLFLYQDYPNLQWVIIDNGKDSIKDLLPPDSRIKYIRVQGMKLTHGKLMNLAMDHSDGKISIVIDDDDWFSPSRISRQVTPLLTDSRFDVSGPGSIYYYIHGTRKAFLYKNFTSMKWVAALAFRPSLWGAGICGRFNDKLNGADTDFIGKVPSERVCVMDDLGLMVSSIHSTNAAFKRPTPPSFTEVPWATIEGVTKGTL